MPRTKPRRPWPRAERVAGEEPRAATVTPARIARAMDMTGARHLSEDESARMINYLWEQYPEVKGCPDWDTRLFKLAAQELREGKDRGVLFLHAGLRTEALKLAFAGNLKAIQYCEHNLPDGWKVPAPVQVNTGNQQNNILVQVGVTPEEAQAMLAALREAGVLQ